MLLENSCMQETIVAVSSPPGRSPRGLVRISGPGARAVFHALLHKPSSAEALQDRTLVRVELADPRVPALACCFASPGSYTGQDLFELQTPGHPQLLERLLHRAMACGARLAEPGEFTFRGFLSGRFDLTEAEGIAASIAAVSDSQLEAARLLRQGALGSLACGLVDDLGTQLALVEAGIDFVDEEDVTPIGPAALCDAVQRVAEAVSSLLERSRSWGVLEALPRVVLAGAPSTGKSTLFNALLGRQRAVIDAVAGTTRDVLAEPITLQGMRGQPVEAMLVDIAGLDRPTADLDVQVQQAAHSAIEQADVLVIVHDATRPDHQPAPAIEAPRAAKVHVLGKANLAEPSPTADADDRLAVSGLTGRGLDALREAIARALGDRAVSVRSEMLALQPRHEQALQASLVVLQRCVDLLAPQQSGRTIQQAELVATHLRAALDELAGLGGQLSPDDVIGRIFATFCIGK